MVTTSSLASKNLDIWFDTASDNPERVHMALQRFGAPLSDLSIDDLASDGLVFQIGVPPNRIDVLNQISGGIDFQLGRKIFAMCGRLSGLARSRAQSCEGSGQAKS